MEKVFQVIGFVLLLMALGFGLYSYTWVPSGTLPTYTLVGASGGYAVAAGLCFVASALASRGGRGPNSDGGYKPN